MAANSISSDTPCSVCGRAYYPVRDGVGHTLCRPCWVDQYETRQDVHDTTVLEALAAAVLGSLYFVGLVVIGWWLL